MKRPCPYRETALRALASPARVRVWRGFERLLWPDWLSCQSGLCNTQNALPESQLWFEAHLPCFFDKE
jgi:hypothetical protein